MSQRALALTEWVLVFTTIDPEVLSAETVLEMYRVRWQIELVFKRWKSLLDVDRLRSKVGTSLGDTWIHGKLLYTLMVERRARRTYGEKWARLDIERRSTWWRIWKMVRTEIEPMITGALFWRNYERPTCLEILSERTRARTLQRVPQAIAA